MPSLLGDRILVAVAEALREEARDSDICCRLGGDEFAVILRLTNDPVEARIIAMPDAPSVAAALREARHT